MIASRTLFVALCFTCRILASYTTILAFVEQEFTTNHAIVFECIIYPLLTPFPPSLILTLLNWQLWSWNQVYRRRRRHRCFRETIVPDEVIHCQLLCFLLWWTLMCLTSAILEVQTRGIGRHWSVVYSRLCTVLIACQVSCFNSHLLSNYWKGVDESTGTLMPTCKGLKRVDQLVEVGGEAGIVYINRFQVLVTLQALFYL